MSARRTPAPKAPGSNIENRSTLDKPTVVGDRVSRPEPSRDRYGRYLIEGDPYTRPTTITKTLSDQHGLTQWKMRMVADGLGQRKDLHALAVTLDPVDDKRQLDKVCKDAMDAASASSGANVGTALHKASEIIDAGGTPPDMPGDFNQRLALYTRTLTEAGVRFDPERIEQILVCSNWNGDGSGPRIAGTTDRVAELPDGRRVIADLKTGRNLAYSWQEISMQLAIYANHDRSYDAVKDKLGPPIPDLDRTVGLVIHLPSSGPVACDLYLIDLDAGLEAVDYALWVRDWRKRNGLAEVYRPTKLPAENRGGGHAETDWIRERIQNLADHPAAIVDLRSKWPTGIPQPLPDRLDAAGLGTMIAVLDTVEGRHQIPFGTLRPGNQNKGIRK